MVEVDFVNQRTHSPCNCGEAGGLYIRLRRAVEQIVLSGKVYTLVIYTSTVALNLRDIDVPKFMRPPCVWATHGTKPTSVWVLSLKLRLLVFLQYSPLETGRVISPYFVWVFFISHFCTFVFTHLFLPQ